MRGVREVPDELPPILFVTGTDTGVGKTVVTAALAAHLYRGGPLAVIKPLQTGVGPGDPGDVDEVRRLSGLDASEVQEWVRLRDPLAPTTAARRQGVELQTVERLAADVRTQGLYYRQLIVEGAGGLLVGLDGAGRDLADLAGHLERREVGFMVVVRAGLGTLNHARLTVEALRARDLPVAGLVIGSWPAAPDLAEECNLADLPLVTGVPVIGRIPAGAGAMRRADFCAAADGWFDIRWRNVATGTVR